MKHPAVRNATVSYGTSTYTSANSEATKTKYISAQVYISKNDTANEDLAYSLAVSIVKKFPEARTKDTLNVNMIYGFDIGIASKWNSHLYKFKPTELITTE